MVNSKIWFMEGLSSQREIVQAATSLGDIGIQVFASHRKLRNEILAAAHVGFFEPLNNEDRLQFIESKIKKHGIRAIQVGRNCRWHEARRIEIESMGVSLTTGATSVDSLDIADSKLLFAQKMEALGLPVVPTVGINTVDELRQKIFERPFGEELPCVKPIVGIYGEGFWTLDEKASSMASFNNPDDRRVHPDIYLNALESSSSFRPMVLMPYLPGPEHSIDMLVEKGHVVAAIGRLKNSVTQELVNSGHAYSLAIECANAMGADGLVNVQTRKDSNGNTVLLEINMRPSGGIGYTFNSGVNLAQLFTLRKLGLISREDAAKKAAMNFKSVVIRPVTQAVDFPVMLSGDSTVGARP